MADGALGLRVGQSTGRRRARPWCCSRRPAAGWLSTAAEGQGRQDTRRRTHHRTGQTDARRRPAPDPAGQAATGHRGASKRFPRSRLWFAPSQPPAVDRRLRGSTVGARDAASRRSRNKDRPSQGDLGMSRRHSSRWWGRRRCPRGLQGGGRAATGGGTIAVTEVRPGEDVFAYIGRVKGASIRTLYRQVIGAANDFKEGDQAIGVAAADEATRENAGPSWRTRRWRSPCAPAARGRPAAVDLADHGPAQHAKVQDWTMGQLKEFLLAAPEPEIKGVMHGLTSDTIGCVPKLMSNQELSPWARRSSTCCPAPGWGRRATWAPASSPTRPPTTPTTWSGRCSTPLPTPRATSSSAPTRWTARSRAWPRSKTHSRTWSTPSACRTRSPGACSHIDVQAEVAERHPGTVATMFQSLAGTDDCNKIFDVTVTKILKYAQSKQGERYGLYFETGQGSEFTNGAANGVDMMVLEFASTASAGPSARSSPRCAQGFARTSTTWPGSSGRRSSRAASSW